ncbi:MAG: hypothetical protein QOI48_1589 [Solirubrobacteraceae bacterium]|nr:hypothetical protein [Solirubrobacteraceae bacterium]
MNVCACAAVAAAVVGAIGCGGGGERQDASDAGGRYVVDVERAQFPARQRIAQRSSFVITIRNAGHATIPNLAVTLRGFTRRASNSRDANASVSLWTIDQPPPGSQTAIEDTWDAGALRPGRRATLRWRVTPIVAGTHALSYSIAPSLLGSARAQLAGGGVPRSTLTVKVDAKPAIVRVDPRTGRVVRDE